MPIACRHAGWAGWVAGMRRTSRGRVPQAELVAACDPSARRARLGRAPARRRASLHRLCGDARAAGLEAVFLVTPTTLHAQQIVDALRARKHVFSEKPLSLDVGECQRVEAEAALQPDLKVMIGFVRRFDTSFRHAHARIRQGISGGR